MFLTHIDYIVWTNEQAVGASSQSRDLHVHFVSTKTQQPHIQLFTEISQVGYLLQ